MSSEGALEAPTKCLSGWGLLLVLHWLRMYGAGLLARLTAVVKLTSCALCIEYSEVRL